MITSVQLQNFKGHNRAYQFGPATMIVGDNFRGKTGLFQAVALLVHGWLKHPAGDKKLDPFGLASGNPMQINAVFNDTDIVRTWTRDRKSSVRYSGYEGPPLMPPILMDARTYFDLSPDKRMRYVFSAVKLHDDAFSPAALVAQLKNLKVDPMTAVHQSALNEVIQLVSSSWQGFESEKGMGADITVQDWIAKLIETLKERAKLAKQAVDRMAKTVSGITELQVRDTAVIDANTAAAENRMQSLREKLGVKQKELGRIQERIDAAESKLQKLPELVAELNMLPKPDDALIAQCATVQADLMKIQALLRDMDKELGRMESELKSKQDAKDGQLQLEQALEAIDGELESCPDQSVTIADLQCRLHEAEAASTALHESVSLAKQDHVRLISEEGSLKMGKTRLHLEIVAVRAKVDSLNVATQCPWCSCSGDTFRDTARSHFATELTSLSTKLAELDLELHAKRLAQDSIQQRIEVDAAELSTRGLGIKAFNQSLVAAVGKQEKRSKLLTRREELAKQIVPPADIATAEADMANHQRAIFARAAELRGLQATLGTIADMKRAKELHARIADSPEDMNALRECLTTLTTEHHTLGTEYESLDLDVKLGIAAKADALRQNQAVAERDKAKAEQDMTKLAVEAVTEFQQKMVDRAFSTIIADANQFTNGILDSPLLYREGEIGRERSGTFISHEYLSGTEQALCFAAISVALAMQSPFKLVMIDEMTRLSARNKALVLERMHVLIGAGVINQFIGVDTDDAPYKLLKAHHSDAIQFICL